MPSETEGTVSSIINHLDSTVWNQVAIHAIEKMPKPRLAKESNSILADFVFMQSKLPLKQKLRISEEIDSSKKLYQRGIAGNATIKEKTLRHSVTEVSQEIPKMISNKRVKHQNAKSISHVVTQPSKVLNQTKNSFFRLFVSNVPEEQTKKDEVLRTTKYEILRYNQRQDDLQRQKRIFSQQRYLTQQKKIKEAKIFTYDYEGKVVSVPVKPSGNVKVFNIKPFFKNTPRAQKLNKSNLSFTNKIDPSKTATISNKRVVTTQSKLDQEERQGSKFNRFRKGNSPNNMTQLFQNNREVEMGVSITDLGNNSTIYGQNRNSKAKNQMKLSEFKEIRSEFKPKNRPKSIIKSKQALLQTQVKNQTPKQTHIKVQVIDSDAQSRLLSSSFSHFFQRTGKIIKNNKLFNESFGGGF